MGVHLNWHNSAILHYTFDRNWTWDVFYQATRTGYNMIEELDHEVVAIIETIPGMAIPGNILTHSKSMGARKHERTKMVIVVVPNTYLRTMVNLARKLSSHLAESVEITSTLEEALELAEQQTTIV